MTEFSRLLSGASKATFEGMPQIISDLCRFKWDTRTIDQIKIDFAPGTKDQLETEIRNLFKEYIEGNRLGNGTAYLCGDTHDISLEQFIHQLVLNATKLEGERLENIIEEWLETGCITYKVCALLPDIRISKDIETPSGLRLAKRQNVFSGIAEQPDHLPPMVLELITRDQAEVATKISIDCVSRPSFFKPSPAEHPSQSWDGLPIRAGMETDMIEKICQALSLTANYPVCPTITWKELGTVEGMVLGSLNWTKGLEQESPYLHGYTSREQSISKGEVEDAVAIARKYLLNGKLDSSKETALQRWVRSKRAYGQTDKLIELRIALEALYMGNDPSERTFRLSNYAAWHLGETFKEREEVRKTVKDIYALASKAIHEGHVKLNESKMKLLERAQEICRRGVRKRLHEKKKPQWDTMILGG